jgi:uncharacterized protein YgiM (DUF1202 family)
VARLSPFEASDTLFTVGEGEMVKVRGAHGAYLRIDDGRGRSGWVSSTEVTPIVPE